MRLVGAAAKEPLTAESVPQALLAHLCRCTGWQTVVEAAGALGRPSSSPARSLEDASRRAELEGGTAQRVSPAVALGGGGFAGDTAPAGCLVAVRTDDGAWVTGPTLTEARRRAGKVQGRRTTEPIRWPIELPVGEWDRVVQTTWVEPAYLEPDESWCVPGGEPASPFGNGGAFGGKLRSEVAEVAQRLANEHGRAVRAVYSREDVVRLGPKRPPLAAGLRADGSGIVRVAAGAGVAGVIAAVLPRVEVEEVDVVGPPVSGELRGAGWAEAAVLRAALAPAPDTVTTPSGARATATISDSGVVKVAVECGEVLDEVVLRSYCIGAAHMALGWVRTEGVAVDERGVPHDLTIRSFGVLRAVDTPAVEITLVPSAAPPVNGSDAVFAAVAAAAWRALGYPPRWPARR
jgi:hypothetical protein